MIVYVETNFILEMVFVQEQSQQAEEILKLGEAGEIEIRFPLFGLIEPFWTIEHRRSDRKKVYENLENEFKQLERSKNYKTIITAMRPLIESLINTSQKEDALFEQTLEIVLKICRFIEITEAIFKYALIYRDKYLLSFQDSLIYSSLIEDMTQNKEIKKCFLSKNSKDFDSSDIKNELKQYNCKYISNFQDGLNYIKSKI